ncbi:hypothetical protein D5S17_27130 [Pseudonocardiaceae bacterium YIM PH 21723]|nr:hypothetical protein D5S17_27130 [Pseudonocardiaceae bacterium YIM PH 21723]
MRIAAFLLMIVSLTGCSPAVVKGRAIDMPRYEQVNLRPVAQKLNPAVLELADRPTSAAWLTEVATLAAQIKQQLPGTYRLKVWDAVNSIDAGHRDFGAKNCAQPYPVPPAVPGDDRSQLAHSLAKAQEINHTLDCGRFLRDAEAALNAIQTSFASALI